MCIERPSLLFPEKVLDSLGWSPTLREAFLSLCRLSTSTAGNSVDVDIVAELLERIDMLEEANRIRSPSLVPRRVFTV